MELKKSSDANIEKLRLPITLMALLFVGSLVLASFSYTAGVQPDKTALDERSSKQAKIEEDIVVQKQDEPQPQQQAQVEPPLSEEEPEVIENKEEEPDAGVISNDPPDVEIDDTPKEPVKIDPVDFPDVEASFPGGPAEMQKWIQENIEYPQISIEMGDQGKVWLGFVVDVDGSISSIEVKRGVSDELDREAKRVLRAMPKWIPGEKDARKVPTKCTIPINFVLR